MQSPTVAIVTCWYQHPELLEDYLDAVLPELGSGDEAIVVDNGGGPSLRPPFRVVGSGHNLGFARGSNYGLGFVTAEAAIFLNNDIALGHRGWLDEIRAQLEPGVLVGSLRGDFHAHVDGRPVPYLDGWCLGGMRDEIEELGGFDEGLEEPAYYSDNLLCLEARAAGMALRDTRVGLVHKLNVTAGSAGSPDVQAASAANRARYIARVRDVVAA